MKWISVQDDLPKRDGKLKKSKDVLISDGTRVMESCLFFYGEKTRWCYQDTIGIKPTHWMHLPEPPKQQLLITFRR